MQTASSATEAVARYRAAVCTGRAPHIVLIDHKLPDHDGVWLTAELRALDTRRESMLILMSSLAGEAAATQAASYDRQVTKPLRRNALARLLEDVVNGGRSVEAAPVAPAPAPLAGYRALLVDDNAVNQKLGERLLGNLGLAVASAWNGSEALAALQAGRYDVVLMDCQMPEMDGYEATRRLRAGEAGPENAAVPVIAMTANALAGDRERCLAAGMDDYIPKPVERKRLRATLERALLAGTGASSATPLAGGATTHADWAALDTMFAGDEVFLAELVSAFVATLPALAERAVAAAVLGDVAAMQSAAHQIKGAALGVHAGLLAEAAGRWEAVAAAPSATELDAFQQVVEATRVAFAVRAHELAGALRARVATSAG